MRVRINVLSEIPAEWRPRLARLAPAQPPASHEVDGAPVPGANEEYLLYQTLVGAWPIDADRLRALHAQGACARPRCTRAGSIPTSATTTRSRRFVEAILDPDRSRAFLDDFVPFQARVAGFGTAQLAGPDAGQAHRARRARTSTRARELWDLSLVDPDNRRPVDWAGARAPAGRGAGRRSTAATDRGALARELVKSTADGRVKLFVIHAGPRRSAGPTRALFARGDYRPLGVARRLAPSTSARSRGRGAGDAAAVTIVPRLLARRGVDALPLGAEYWADTRLRAARELAGRYTNAFTGERGGDGARPATAAALPLADVFAELPGARSCARRPR